MLSAQREQFIAPEPDFVVGGVSYTLAPENNLGKGGQGEVYYAVAQKGEKVWPVAIKESMSGSLTAHELLVTLNGLFDAKFDLNNINSIDLITLLERLLLAHKTITGVEHYDIQPLVEAVASRAAYDVVAAVFPGDVRILAAESIILVPEKNGGEIYFRQYIAYPLLPQGAKSLNQAIYEQLRADRRMSMRLSTLSDYFYELATIYEQLEIAHDNGIIHRDIKPGNIMLVDGKAILMDFGVASITKPRPYENQGTVDFIAPDALQKERWNPQSDQFSMFATLLYSLLQMLDIPDSTFLLRERENWGISEIFSNGFNGTSEELLHDIFDTIQHELLQALPEEVMLLRAYFEQGLRLSPSKRHINPVAAIREIAKIIAKIAERYRLSTANHRHDDRDHLVAKPPTQIVQTAV